MTTRCRNGGPQADRYRDGLQPRVSQTLSDHALRRLKPACHSEGYPTRYRRRVIFFAVAADQLILAQILYDRMNILRHLDGDLRG